MIYESPAAIDHWQTCKKHKHHYLYFRQKGKNLTKFFFAIRYVLYKYSLRWSLLIASPSLAIYPCLIENVLAQNYEQTSAYCDLLCVWKKRSIDVPKNIYGIYRLINELWQHVVDYTFTTLNLAHTQLSNLN